MVTPKNGDACIEAQLNRHGALIGKHESGTWAGSNLNWIMRAEDRE